MANYFDDINGINDCMNVENFVNCTPNHQFNLLCRRKIYPYTINNQKPLWITTNDCYIKKRVVVIIL